MHEELRHTSKSTGNSELCFIIYGVDNITALIMSTVYKYPIIFTNTPEFNFTKFNMPSSCSVYVCNGKQTTGNRYFVKG